MRCDIIEVTKFLSEISFIKKLFLCSMKVVKYLSVVLVGLFLFIACQKELSVESGFAGSVATGSLLNTAGDCKDIAVTGTYITDSNLTENSYVTVQVNFATGGSYKIFTDTQNGFSFQDSGFVGAGQKSIKLKATGRPILAKATTFQVAFDTTFCTFSVTVLGSTPASYSLVSTSGNCSNSTVNGTYTTGTALTANNTVTLEVNVTTTGSYSVKTSTVGGMSFSGTGNLTTLGLQIITLQGSGTPTATGPNAFPVTAGTSTCNFSVPVTASSGGNTNINASDTAWQFTGGLNSFKGPFFDAFDTTIVQGGSSIYGLILLGYTPATGDTTMQLGVFFPGSTIQPNTYSSKSFAGFYFTNYKDTANPVKIYTADYTTQTVNTSVTITSYDATTKIVTGTFTGTALLGSGIPVPITNGKFKAKVR
jgi:hypothetical protein